VHQVGHYPESHQDARSTKHKKHKMWSNKWYLKRNISCDAHLLNELLETAVEDYINYLRMNEQPFNMLLTEVSPYIQKKETEETVGFPE
jgi:hypothetical protein